MAHGTVAQEKSGSDALAVVVAENVARNGNRPWYKNRGIRNLNILLILALITATTNGYDDSMMNGLQAFNHPRSHILGLLNAIQNIGSLVALPLSPFVSDGVGRRKALFLGVVIMLIATAVQSAATNVAMFIAARGLIGFGLGFATNAAPLLITELAYPTHRGLYTSLYNSTWYLGSIIAAWVTFGTFQIDSTWSWRILSIIQGLPSVIHLFFIWTVPESPRWLIAKGRFEEARVILAKYHANKDLNDPLAESVATEGVSFRTLVSTRGNRRRLLIIGAIAFFSQWSGNGLVSYYLVPVLNSIGVTDSFDQQLINGILQIWNYITAIIAVEDGREPSASAGNAVIAMIYLFYTFYNLAYSPLLVAYTVEILPFKIRAKGLAFMNFCVSAALVFNQYVNPLALEAISWKYYLVFAIWLAVELVFAYFFIVETKGHTLEEIAAIFDGNTAEIQQMGTVHDMGSSDITIGKSSSV
ncbi:hypothetical protein HK097_007307 [Rhizophlyctis rosea]|uniref:Major facilitator superfamily (MFS) profile domain-containing protein n=1 Tax=Rhizophlyctis rosea TaxID=64517 RepID=A0AAD5SLS9_9FUNG|nr:hypothetical protein HK097_007307 [Rhizophlyctis rosea]